MSFTKKLFGRYVNTVFPEVPHASHYRTLFSNLFAPLSLMNSILAAILVLLYFPQSHSITGIMGLWFIPITFLLFIISIKSLSIIQGSSFYSPGTFRLLLSAVANECICYAAASNDEAGFPFNTLITSQFCSVLSVSVHLSHGFPSRRSSTLFQAHPFSRSLPNLSFRFALLITLPFFLLLADSFGVS